MMNSCYYTTSYDKANQLVSSTTDGKVTDYAYDAAGRLSSKVPGLIGKQAQKGLTFRQTNENSNGKITS